MPDTLGYYKENAKDLMFAKYQYVLASWEDEDGDVITTKEPGAEKFSMTSLYGRVIHSMRKYLSTASPMTAGM